MGLFRRLGAAFHLGRRVVAVVIEGSLVAQELLKFMEERPEWVGTATELLEALESVHGEEFRRRKGWPSSLKSFGR